MKKRVLAGTLGRSLASGRMRSAVEERCLYLLWLPGFVAYVLLRLLRVALGGLLRAPFAAARGAVRRGKRALGQVRGVRRCLARPLPPPPPPPLLLLLLLLVLLLLLLLLLSPPPSHSCLL